jgi:signal transduction histidine kinase
MLFNHLLFLIAETPMLSQTPPKIDRVLAVDDLPMNLILIETILEDEGYEVTSVTDGEAALTEVEQHLPDLVLLDVMMPDMDGYEVTRRIRQNTQLPYIPILLITAYDKADVVEGLEAGADDFVRKPIDADELIARVRSLLRLKHSIDEREQMMLQRQDFIAHLTHDLRTPLVAADMMFKLFQKEAFCPLSENMHEAVSALTRSNKNLLEMVNILLEVQCYDAGAKALTLIPCPMREIAEDIVQELSPIAKDKGIDLRLEIVDTTEVEAERFTIVGDCSEIRRMLTNLIGNSLKFTEAGSVVVRLTPPEPGEQFLVIEVQDTGPGIPTEELPNLFQRFRKGTHKMAGSGLGLHLVQRILDVHQGTIEVQSELGHGSLFTVKLPIRELSPLSV